MNTQALHITFDDSPETKGDPIYFVANDNGVRKLTGKKDIAKWAKSLSTTDTVRVTNMSFFVPQYGLLKTTGAQFVTCHWHKTGIKKGLEPEQIAAAFQALGADLLTPVIIREDLLLLKSRVAARNAVMTFRKSAGLKLGAIQRSLGISDKDEVPEWLEDEKEELATDTKAIETPLEKAVAECAQSIPECIALNQVLGVKNAWMTAASAVAYIGDIHRFPAVSSLWHYAGYHVVDGKAPKRAKGQVQTWNPKLRTALWSWSASMLKTKNPIWRPVYDQYRAAEMAEHASKCDCSTIEGHCGARARRRVVKDVLKQFWLTMQTDGTMNTKSCVSAL